MKLFYVYVAIKLFIKLKKNSNITKKSLWLIA